jgi:hypothetical protein
MVITPQVGYITYNYGSKNLRKNIKQTTDSSSTAAVNIGRASRDFPTAEGAGTWIPRKKNIIDIHRHVSFFMTY